MARPGIDFVGLGRKRSRERPARGDRTTRRGATLGPLDDASGPGLGDRGKLRSACQVGVPITPSSVEAVGALEVADRGERSACRRRRSPGALARRSRQVLLRPDDEVALAAALEQRSG